MLRINAAVLGCGLAMAATTALAQGGHYRLVYAFSGTDGAYPIAGLSGVSGTLYGTTSEGGSHGNPGAVFSLNPKTGAEQVVYSFAGPDGSDPAANLINLRGTLYGTTRFGGEQSKCQKLGCGVVFSLNPATGAERLEFAFKGSAYGANPQAGLVGVGGTLYGTTSGGGSKNCPNGCGLVFSLNPKTGTEKIIYLFQGGNDGTQSYGNLTNVGGTLYGTTRQGGGSGCNNKGCGTIFSLDVTTGAEQVVHAFQGGSDGATPLAGMIDVGGTLYGTTSSGGASLGSDGTVFSFNPATGVEKVLYAFQGQNDGNSPRASLTSFHGVLYGTTLDGGDGCGCGTVFSVNPATGAEAVLHAFDGGTDGEFPEASLTNVGNTLYGTTGQGGTNCNCGTVFALKP
jgi:uncharacterized repeat protein (TIGR03803 family)